jgi:hypothetical protein
MDDVGPNGRKRITMRYRIAALLVIGLLGAASLLGEDAPQNAATLKAEAMAILQQASSSSTDPKAYAAAMVKLEQAQKLLQQAQTEDTPLGQEVTAALFWARKFSNVQSISEADRLRGTGDSVAKTNPPTPATKPAGTELAANGTEENPAVAAQLALAKRKYEEAERFAKDQAANDFIVALKWFQVADEVNGTDYAVKALSHARSAQERYAAKMAAAKAVTETKKALGGPEYDLIHEGDLFLAENRTEEATSRYEASYKLKDNAVAHGKLGHMLFDRAQAMKDSLMPQFEAQQREYRDAVQAATRVVNTLRGGSRKEVDWNNPRILAAKKAGEQLAAKAREAVGYYDRAAMEFSKSLSLEKVNLDAAAHQALCYSVRGDVNCRAKARNMLTSIMKDYQPTNDVERTLYEFCKTELKRITAR